MERQKELAKAERLRRMEEAHLESLQQKLNAEIDDLAPLKQNLLNLRRLTQSILYQQRLTGNMAMQRQAIAAAQRKEDRQRELLIEAARDEKVFDNLGDRQRERYLIELEQWQQKDTDEIATNSFLQGVRKGSGEDPR